MGSYYSWPIGEDAKPKPS